MGIGASEYSRKQSVMFFGAEGGGAPPQNQCVVECPVHGSKEMHLKNMGDEAATFELLARGELQPVAGESIAALQVGVTDQFQGLLANREVVPGTFTATDAGGATQTVTDDGHGNIIDALSNIVGTIDYENGYVNFTWAAAFVGPVVTAGYNHNNWMPFAAPITGSIVPGGGEADIILLPNGGDNYADGTKNMTHIGIMAYTAGLGTRIRAEAVHTGSDELWKFNFTKRFRNLNSPE